MTKLEIHHEDNTYALVVTGIQKDLLQKLVSHVSSALLTQEATEVCSDIIAGAIADYHCQEVSGLPADAPWTLSINLEVLEDEVSSTSLDENAEAA